MQVILEAIQFNHNSASATCDAFNIRRNETEFVTTPEWRRGRTVRPEQSLAAYAIKEIGQNVITIKAKFRCRNPKVKGVEVRVINLLEHPCGGLANDADGAVLSTVHPPPPGVSDVLGIVPPQPVKFLKDGEILKLKDSKLSQAGVGTHIIHWQWQYRRDAQDSWKNLEKSCHTIYVVHNVPKRPWLQEPYDEDNKQLPWTDVLDYACHWANHTHQPDEAAARVTSSLRDVEKVFLIVYDPSSFYSDPNFDCTAFLQLLKDGIGKGNRLNCSDCATVVSTFANILGCALWQSTMDMTGTANTFRTNPIRLFGRTCWRETNFVMHEVAWKARCSERDSLFDATLELDGDDRPSKPPQTPLLPRNLRFGGLRDREYLFRLFSPSNSGSLEPRPTTKQRRPIRPNPTAKVKPLSPALLKLVKALYEFDKWPKTRPSNNIFITPDFVETSLTTKKSFLGLNFLVGPHLVQSANRPPTIQMLIKLMDQHIRIDIDVCSSGKEARKALLQRLGQFETPTLQRRTDLEIGEIAFVEPEVGALLFLRSNLVGMIRNAGTAAANMTDFGPRLDLLFLDLMVQQDA